MERENIVGLNTLKGKSELSSNKIKAEIIHTEHNKRENVLSGNF